MIRDDIRNFNTQFAYVPKIENAANLKKFRKFLLCGMGGSHLAIDLVAAWKPEFDIIVWKGYGLPPLPASALKERLVIASSYSGNTEETLDAFETARKKGLAIAAFAAGGKLIERARKYKVPYVAMPDTHIQPRLSLGLGGLSALALMGEKAAIKEFSALKDELYPARLEKSGKKLAKRLRGSAPIIYASDRNRAIAENFKIVLNETGKIPAFWNVLPELNHNEMTGFDVRPVTRGLSRHFYFVLLEDGDDHPRTRKRMRILEALLKGRGFEVIKLPLRGASRLLKIFTAISLAHWTAYHTAMMYGLEPEQVPMVEEFKKSME